MNWTLDQKEVNLSQAQAVFIHFFCFVFCPKLHISLPHEAFWIFKQSKSLQDSPWWCLCFKLIDKFLFLFFFLLLQKQKAKHPNYDFIHLLRVSTGQKIPAFALQLPQKCWASMQTILLSHRCNASSVSNHQKRGQRLTSNQTPSEHLSPLPPLLSFDWWPLRPRLPFLKCEIVTLEALAENTDVNLMNAALICSVSSCHCTKINPLSLSF